MAIKDRTRVLVEDGRLQAEGYSTGDPIVVSHFERLGGNDLVVEFDKCVSLGVSVAEVAAPVLTVDFVQRAFEGTITRQEELVATARVAIKDEISGILAPLLGSDGLTRTLREAREQIEQELRKYFDEESARSISATVARRVEEVAQNGERRVASLLQEALDTRDETRGLGRLYKSLQSESGLVQAQLTDLISKVSAIVARKAEIEISPSKGVSFESNVFFEVARIARISGDGADETGFVTGDARRKRGDVVVTVNTALTNGIEGRFTIEAMDRADVSQKAVLKELDEAKANRSASAAIAVLSSRLVPASAGQALRWFPGNRFICVLDKETWAPLALEVAYCWARLGTMQASNPGVEADVDLERVQGLVDEAARHLLDLEKLRTKLGVGRSALLDSEAIVSELEAKLVGCLSRISAMLEGPGQQSQLTW